MKKLAENHESYGLVTARWPRLFMESRWSSLFIRTGGDIIFQLPEEGFYETNYYVRFGPADNDGVRFPLGACFQKLICIL